MVTDTLAVKSVADEAGWVIYDPRKQQSFAGKVLKGLRGLTDDLRIAQVLVAAASFMKHPGFQPEAEFRLLTFPDVADVQFRESGDRIVPYVDFLRGRPALPISRILVGPGWRLSSLDPPTQMRHHVVQGIRRLLTARGLTGTEVKSSSLPYDPR